MNTLLILTNLPDRATAESMATLLVRDRLAACVNILQPCQSIYRWNDEIETATEIPLLIKTTEARYPALEKAIRLQHPYETPEIIALSVTGGFPEYLDWVAQETAQKNGPAS
ncbi:divalent-cation tolerance protein CutA [Propionivibrio sp.]|uniref:divalent-cation tolerance protein CutA n=1 Tax=Propionivibrio sp. TaxID=2212460 RepID=UPI0025D41749|nr:divalent-cation tolerance protein CutA [Propionivibrio sp.]MBK7354892.1 divalent-cation tolerance protein CutA [Propionivibrio sp.]